MQLVSQRKQLKNSESEKCTDSENFLFKEPAHYEVLPWLEIRDLSRLGRTCRFFQPLLPMARAAHYVVVQPSEIEIIKMLNAANPELLRTLLTTKIAKVATKSRTIINSTLLQLAFCAGDDDMCYTLEPYFEYVFGSVRAKELICKQLNQKFPEGSEEEKQQREAEDLEIKNVLTHLLAKVTQAITDEPFDRGQDDQGKWLLRPHTRKAIRKFKKSFDALQPKIIDNGMHFRLNTLLETFDAYVAAGFQWRFDSKRCTLFEDGVFSVVLSYLPENDAQRCSQGLWYLQKENPEPFERRLTLRNSSINFYDHLRQASSTFSSISGSGIDIGSAYTEGAGPRWPRGSGRRGVILDSYFAIKTFNLQHFRDQSENSPRFAPTIIY